MIVEDLIKELQKQKPGAEVILSVDYTEHYCSNDGYCYCTNEEHFYTLTSIATQKPPKKLPKNYKEDNRVYLRGEL